MTKQSFPDVISGRLVHKDNNMPKKTVASDEAVNVNNVYELMLIFSSNLREPDVKKKLKEIEEMVDKAGGKVTQEDFWGKKPLAFRIKKQVEGVYMKEHLRIEKDLLRSMIIKLPEGYTYTKYDMTVTEERPKKERPYSRKNVSIKHNAPIIKSKKRDEKSEETPEKSGS